MVGRRLGAALALLAALALVNVPLAADGVGDGSPTISTPTESSALYAGFDGPFVVNFDDAPIGDYDWSVKRVPTDGPPQVVVEDSYHASGVTGFDAQLDTPALTAGDYTFAIADHATGTHADELDFTVRPGPAPTCAVVVPSKVRVNAPTEKVATHLVTRCADLHVVYAAWKISHSTQGFTDSLVFDGTSTDTWTIFDGDPMGRYLVQPKSARSDDNIEVPQNSPSPVVRRDSRLRLGGWRSGGSVTLTTSLNFYSATANGFRPWAAKPVTLAYRNCTSCAWHTLRTLTTNSHGTTSLTIKASGARDYRVRAGGTSVVWDPLAAYKRV